MKRMNPKWRDSENSKSIDLPNEHAVSWLCDSMEWNDYKVEGIAEFAIGAVSVEMYMKAYNVYKQNNPNGTALICKIYNINGYAVGMNGTYDYNGTGPYTPFGMLEYGRNDIFLPREFDGCIWLGSPAAWDEMRVRCVINQDYKCIDHWTISKDYKCEACPLVCIL